MSEERDEVKGILVNYEDNTETRKTGLQIPDNLLVKEENGNEVKIGVWPEKGKESVEPPIVLPTRGSFVRVPVTIRTKDGRLYLNYDKNKAITSPALAKQQTLPVEVVNKESTTVMIPYGGESTPAQQAAFGRNAATVLQSIVTNSKLIVPIQGHDYMKFEGWQAVAGFYGATVATQWVHDLPDGFEASAIVTDKTGRVISSAQANCSRDEPSWKSKPAFQLKSMAQTRACAKALRNVFAWVVVLAGVEPIPAEEMQEEK